MERDKIQVALNKKLDIAWESYSKRILEYSPQLIFNRAEEIAATRLVHQELRKGGYSTDHLEYLLRFEDPLAVVRDQWLDENNVAHDEDMTHVLWSLVDKQHAGQEYALDPAYLEPQRDTGQKGENDHSPSELLPQYKIYCYTQENQFFETTMDTPEAVVDFVCERRGIYEEVRVYQPWADGLYTCVLAMTGGQIRWGEPTLQLSAEIRAQELDWWPGAAADPGYRRITVEQVDAYYVDNREAIQASLWPEFPERSEVVATLARENNPALLMDTAPAEDTPTPEPDNQPAGHDQSQQLG